MSPRNKATHNGLCPVCRHRPALMTDGRLFRHFSGFPQDPAKSWPGGVCRGWGEEPLSIEERP